MDTTTTNQVLEYDVIIIGAGFAGVCQARHLLLNIPNIRLAIVDPRSGDSSEKQHRLGESTVEIASLFLYQQLGLYEYLIENHTPKAGINFHWPKDPANTETMDDYYHIWNNRQFPIPTFHLNRAKFDRDLLQMNKDMGAVHYKGRVVDVDLTPGDASKNLKVKLDDDYLELKAKHLIDAAGRKFILGRKTDNLLFGPENVRGINNGAAWVWVKNVDRNLLDNGYHPTETVASRYYATNHWMGTGHWMWMIPLDRQTMEVSVGLIHHHDIVSANEINSAEKFYNFLKANHNVLYQIIKSGEQIKFSYYPRIAHTSKTLFSPDNWYIIGDAAFHFDALYSLGTTMSALGIESVTEIIRAKLLNESNAEEKREVYNNFNLMFARYANNLVSKHAKQLGNASIMSWRLYLEPMWWFGVMVPIYFGKWHLNLDPKFISSSLSTIQENINFFSDIYEQFDKLVDKGVNIGLLDQYRADQLPGHYYVSKHFDLFLQNAKLEAKRCNVYPGLRATAFYTAIWFVIFLWKGFGLQGLLAPRNLYHLFRLLILSGKATLADMVYRFQTQGLPSNTHIAKTREEFKSYKYRPELQH